MKKGNSLIFICIVAVCLGIVAIMVYGIINLASSNNSDIGYIDDSEVFDALIDENKVDMQVLKSAIEDSSFFGSVYLQNGETDVDIIGNMLGVTIVLDEFFYSNNFVVENNVIKASVFGDKRMDDMTFEILKVVYGMNFDNKEVIDECVKSNDIDSYTIENSGIELGQNYVSMKIGKKIEVIDFDNMYLTLDDVSKYSLDIKKDGLTKISNGYITAIKTGYSGEITISISEKNKITEATYKSLINVLAIALDYNEVYNEFIGSHSYFENLSDEDTDKYEIRIDPIKETYEQNIFSNDPMIRIKIK